MQHFIAIGGIEHENFGVDRMQLKFFRQFVSPVFEKVLRQTHALLPSFGLRIQPSLQFRFFACRMFNQSVETIVRGNSQSMNRNRIAFVEPKPDCALKLRFSGGNFCDKQCLDTFRHRFQFWSAHQIPDVYLNRYLTTYARPLGERIYASVPVRTRLANQIISFSKRTSL